MAETRLEFRQLARIRLRDARVLLSSGNLEGAYYLTGLAVECAIKACIAKNTRRHDFPPNLNAVKDIYTHNLTTLIRAAKLQVELDTAKQSSILFKNR
jgi:HEPN domain-containing protein